VLKYFTRHSPTTEVDQERTLDIQSFDFPSSSVDWLQRTVVNANIRKCAGTLFYERYVLIFMNGVYYFLLTVCTLL
jgi:hypothetical protein